MYGLILVLTIIICVGLTFIVLIQNPKGGGIAASFSGGSQVMGVKRTNELVEKVTWGLAIILLVLTLTSNLFVSTSTADTEKSALQNQIENNELPELPQIQPTGPANPTELPGNNAPPAPVPADPEG